jgi:hypothetical protein
LEAKILNIKYAKNKSAVAFKIEGNENVIV